MITMLLGGLWHGASWRFVTWGGLHGALLAIERALRRRWGERPWTKTRALRGLILIFTFFMVSIAWVFFRAESFEAAFYIMSYLFGLGSKPGLIQLNKSDLLLAPLAIAALLGSHLMMRNRSLEDLSQKAPWWLKAILISVMIFAILTAPGDQHAFIYFQF
jgi:alginate O-acetyltransferase complex protein AlgI